MTDEAEASLFLPVQTGFIEMIHNDKAGPDEFAGEEKVREQIIRFRAGNVGRHKAADIKG